MRELSTFHQRFEWFLTERHRVKPLPMRQIPKDLDETERVQWSEIKFILYNLLPPLERELIVMTMLKLKKQGDAAAILGISQEMGAYYKKRGLFRIRMWIRHRRIDPERMGNFISRWISRKQAEATMLYFASHSQNTVANKLHITQAAVSSRIMLGYRALRRASRTPVSWGGAETRKELREYLAIVEELILCNSLHSIQWKKPQAAKAANAVCDNFRPQSWHC